MSTLQENGNQIEYLTIQSSNASLLNQNMEEEKKGYEQKLRDITNQYNKLKLQEQDLHETTKGDIERLNSYLQELEENFAVVYCEYL